VVVVDHDQVTSPPAGVGSPAGGQTARRLLQPAPSASLFPESRIRHEVVLSVPYPSIDGICWWAMS
jgi:hypothetical protein